MILHKPIQVSFKCLHPTAVAAEEAAPPGDHGAVAAEQGEGSGEAPRHELRPAAQRTQPGLLLES